MKIRSGFVSNSSSSSFIIRGVKLTDKLVDLIFLNEDKLKEEFLELYKQDEDSEENIDFYNITSYLKSFLKKKDIKLDVEQTCFDEYYGSDTENSIFIGKEIRANLEGGNVVEIDDLEDTDTQIHKELDKLNPEIQYNSKLKIYMQYMENH